MDGIRVKGTQGSKCREGECWREAEVKRRDGGPDGLASTPPTDLLPTLPTYPLL